ncbi:MAG: endonuclease III domain-containing protein [Oscillospiraceae bacterium]|nr:endonuclease III domain-containing protein [Oscillospiraceae bacterium]MCL2279238.1 endonuclease III domain-containing protein [Oscillospiraceae bacterium]
MKNNIQTIYKNFTIRYGDLRWWPAKTPYEVMVGAILTQNTAWGNVEKAIANFGANLSPKFVQNADISTLAEIIHPAGFFNQKSVYLKTMTDWFARYDFDVPTVQREPLKKLRPELLSVKGIGKETADSILLYAFDFPTFVVDAYTVRLFNRYPVETKKDYDSIKTCFEENLPKSVEVYNNFHAMIVINAKEHCRKKPLCTDCPLAEFCEKRG